MTVNINADSMCYNGVCAEDFWSENRDVEVQPHKEVKISILIPYSKYKDHVLESKTMRVEALTKPPWSSKGFHTSKNVILSSPALSLQVFGMPFLFADMEAEVVMENPLDEPLTDCVLTLTGPGLLRSPRVSRVANIGPKTVMRAQISFEPFKMGKMVLVANFKCNLFKDIKAYSTVNVVF
uniref:Protein-glutamine gamma-glutamyltransferase E-like n=1 Tax=Lepisosteus oculatus TaxID=7918 RepID=W5MJK8_LEPOC|nr:PREDICTED: protein-glutamine gamma-glutamyltransferase E-like [Lepisosteus oculatus]